MTSPRIRRRSLYRIISSRDDLYEFGNKNQSSTNNGDLSSTGCTQAGIRLGVRVWHGTEITIDDVSKAVGYTTEQKNNHQGMTGLQLARAFKHFDLPYKQSLNIATEALRNIVDHIGPVFAAVGYDNYPEWFGYKYHGRTADGFPNGYSLPRRKSGRNQITNAGFGHFVTIFGHRDRKDIQRGLHRYWLHDPNHRSSARPKPSSVDFMSEEQLYRMLWRVTKFINANVPVVWVPTKVWTP